MVVVFLVCAIYLEITNPTIPKLNEQTVIDRTNSDPLTSASAFTLKKIHVTYKYKYCIPILVCLHVQAYLRIDGWLLGWLAGWLVGWSVG